MNTPGTATHVFYSPSDNGVIDTCTDEAEPRGHYSGMTLEQIRTRGRNPYPDAIYAEWETTSKLMDEKNRLPVSIITKEYFWEMLEVLPPDDWHRGGNDESFKMCEHWSGNITSIFARIGNKYFTLRDDDNLKHDEIIRRCKEFSA